MKKLIIAMIALFVAAPMSSAWAEPVQTLDVRVKDVKSNGLFKMIISARSFDTTGAKGPVLKTTKLFFPSVANINPRGFPTCDVKKLKKERDTKVCKKAKIGSGRAKADVRPLFTDLIDSKLTLFLGKPSKTQKDSSGSKPIMNLIIFAEPISNDQLVKNTKLTLEAPIFKDRSDRRFGSRLDMELNIDTGIPGVTISIAELTTTTKPKFRYARTCKKKRRGKCVDRSKKKVPLFKLRKCPKSKKIFFKGEFTLLDGPLITQEVELPCRFKIKS